MNFQSLIVALPFSVAIIGAWLFCQALPAKRSARRPHAWDLRGDHDLWLFQWAAKLPFFKPTWPTIRRQGE